MSLGPGEVLVVLVVALLVLGPDKLPRAARQMGRAVAEFRRFTRSMQSEVDKALRDVELDGRPSGEKPQSATLPPSGLPSSVSSAGPSPQFPAEPAHQPDLAGFRLIDGNEEPSAEVLDPDSPTSTNTVDPPSAASSSGPTPLEPPGYLPTPERDR